jgi:hypothetical protein
MNPLGKKAAKRAYLSDQRRIGVFRVTNMDSNLVYVDLQ